MTKPRVPETDQGIQGELLVETYDQFSQNMRDKGLLGWNDLLAAGIDHGHALEIGPGPGYLGLEWLACTNHTHLTGLDISPDMINLAEENARAYNLSDRTTYVLSSGDNLPFEDDYFDAVFTNGSLHEWAKPQGTFNEIWRVLKPGGRVHISDLRRDMAAPLRWMMWMICQPRDIRPGFITSLNAAYTPGELQDLLVETTMQACAVKSNPFGLTIQGYKSGLAV
ncbi:MAG: class I SAM-dependent methyltransferase [Anaerolineales bacterium]|nr:class I SAM-dependent methyltransferase [Anaerolineales bacterium]